MKTRAVFFPFDLFGGAGKAGPELLADAVRELLADNRRERVPTRARAYAGQIHVEEFVFETLDAYQTWRTDGRKAVHAALRRGDFLLWVTGNHLGALPVYDELGQLSPAPLVVQLDAHLDVYNLTDCTTELSHGNFLLHCAGPLPPLINLGHREQLLMPEYVSRFYRHAYSAAEIAIDPSSALAAVRAASLAADRVVVDLDCDAFDAAYFPAVTQPEPFGLDPQFLLGVLDAIPRDRLAGLCISEFDPARDERDRCLATLLWLVEYVLLRLYEKP